MSVSSVGSQASVGFRGGAVPMEQALDETVRDLQKHLNLVQCRLREIAAIVEQDNDFKEEVKLSDALDDELRDMSWLFDDLRLMAYDLITIPEDAEDKLWFKQHKQTRKLEEKRIQAEHAQHLKEERAASKAALKLARSTIAEGNEAE